MAPPAASWRLKPLAKALTAPALLRRNGTVLARGLEEDLFRTADMLSEGGCRPVDGGAESYFGSTMISVDLGPVRQQWRGEFDARARRRLVDAVGGSARVRLRATRLALREVARRLPDRALGTARVEIQVSLASDQLRIDVDLEVPVSVSSRAAIR